MTRNLDNITQQKLEQLFEMTGGYVLDEPSADVARLNAELLEY